MDDLRRDAGQISWIGFETSAMDADLERRLRAGEAGAVILFRRNLEQTADGLDVAGLVALNESLHAAGQASGERLLIAVDQEGGRVQRVGPPATRWPPMERLSRLADGPAEALAREIGAAMGRELAALGFDIDFAPVLDVHTNPANPIIGDRAFAAEPEAAALRALAFAAGLADAGILSCGKHFPGHGDTDQDSHFVLPRLRHDLDRLRRVELVPFALAARAGIPMIMTAHVVFEALDPSVPATLSRRVLGDILRGELGYRGLVVSDDLDMKALSGIGVGEAAVGAIRAGCDVLLLCQDRGHQDEALEALVRAGETDSALRARIGEAAAAVRRLKATPPPPRPPLSVLGAGNSLLAALDPPS
ncbi:MAG TPA: beta-N-acetylhexosaminidase [Kofleriaceae bacterium]|nr:beta-N-acetylhexosaminidase [Kofleriaceae bacterium]